MKHALISPNEPIESGYRVAEVTEQSFEIAPPLFWIECADDVVADQFYYDHEKNEFVLVEEVTPSIEPTTAP